MRPGLIPWGAEACRVGLRLLWCLSSSNHPPPPAPQGAPLLATVHLPHAPGHLPRGIPALPPQWLACRWSRGPGSPEEAELRAGGGSESRFRRKMQRRRKCPLSSHTRADSAHSWGVKLKRLSRKPMSVLVSPRGGEGAARGNPLGLGAGARAVGGCPRGQADVAWVHSLSGALHGANLGVGRGRPGHGDSGSCRLLRSAAGHRQARAAARLSSPVWASEPPSRRVFLPQRPPALLASPLSGLPSWVVWVSVYQSSRLCWFDF